MKKYTEVELKEIFEGDNFEAFRKFVKEFGLEDDFYDITSKHTKERLEALIAAEAEGKKELAGKILVRLQESKTKREALGEVYSNKELVSDMDLEKLYANLSKFMANHEKHSNLMPHEKQILNKWISEIQNTIK